MYKNRQHPTEAECRLFCCPILLSRCRFCNFLKLLSYRHPANRLPLFLCPGFPDAGRGAQGHKKTTYSLIQCRWFVFYQRPELCKSCDAIIQLRPQPHRKHETAAPQWVQPLIGYHGKTEMSSTWRKNIAAAPGNGMEHGPAGGQACASDGKKRTSLQNSFKRKRFSSIFTKSLVHF